MDTALVILICAIGLLWIGFEVGGNQTAHAFAQGELECYYERSELICWNPKEEEK